MVNIPLRIKNLIRRLDTSDPYKIAKELKIEIIVTKVPRHAHGFWRRILKRKIIFLDENLPVELQTVVLCHELGHIILHPQYKSYCMDGRGYYSSTKREDEADQFAAELLSHSHEIEKEYILDFLKNGWKTGQQRNQNVLFSGLYFSLVVISCLTS